MAGPDLLKVLVKDGVDVGVEPNTDLADVHPACGKVCVRAYGLIQKLYNPARIKTPMRRTNPNKGRQEDPGWAPISWDEALGLLADRLNGIRASCSAISTIPAAWSPGWSSRNTPRRSCPSAARGRACTT